jgi:hypothetical protein
MTTPQLPDRSDQADIAGVSGACDLPATWPSQPITQMAALSHVLDVACTPMGAPDDTLWVLFCDEADRLLAPIAIDTLADAPGDSAERARMLGNLMAGLADIDPSGSVLVARARVGGLSATDDDICWADAATRACADRVRLLGVHLVTPDGSRPVPAISRSA